MINYIKNSLGESVSLTVVDKVTITLTDGGKQVLADYLNASKDQNTPEIKYTDISSNITDSLWLIMRVFGPHMELNGDVLISNISAMIIDDTVKSKEQSAK